MKYEQNIELLKAGKIWQNSSSFHRKREKAINVCIDAFAKEEHAYVAISGGKDSIAMAGIVDEAACRIDRDYVLWAHISDASFPGTRETVLTLADRLERELTIDESPVSAFAVIGKQSRQAFGKTGYFFDAIKKFVETSNRRLAFIGVRAAESKRRRNACIAQGQIFKSKTPCPHIKCFPLAWFTIHDVAAAIVHYDLPIHPIYRKISLDNKAIRLGYVTALDLMHLGTVAFLKLNYPGLYNKLIAAYPEAAKYS